MRAERDYGRVKLAGEKVVLEAYAHRGLPAVVLRPAAIYGPEEVNFWAPLFIGVASGRCPCSATEKNRLNLCFIDNVIDAALLAETSPSAIGGTYVISDAEPYRLRDVVSAIANACGVPPPRRAVPRRYADFVAQVHDYLWRLEITEPVIRFLAANVRQWTVDYRVQHRKGAEGARLPSTLRPR